ncbi:putative colanic acid biosynthesis acetyltransferase [Sphingomonas sp. CJ99]
MTILDSSKSNQAEGGPSFSLSHRLFRLVWNLVWAIAAAWTPPPLHRWRAMLLRLFGAKLGHGVRVYGKARIWYPPNLLMEDHAVVGPGATIYNQGRIVIGDHAIVSQGAHLCAGTHDISDPNFQLVTRPITIGRRAWIAAEAFVGPGVTIGEGAVLGARAVAMRDLAAWQVATGNPATVIKERRFRDSPKAD